MMVANETNKRFTYLKTVITQILTNGKFSKNKSLYISEFTKI